MKNINAFVLLFLISIVTSDSIVQENCSNTCNSCLNVFYSLKFKNRGDCQYNICTGLCLSLAQQWNSINEYITSYKENQINVCETCFRFNHCHIQQCDKEKIAIYNAVDIITHNYKFHKINPNNKIINSINKKNDEYFFDMDFVFKNIDKIVSLLKNYEKIYSDTNLLKKYYKIVLKTVTDKNFLQISDINLLLGYDYDEQIVWKDIFANVEIYKQYYNNIKSNNLRLDEEVVFLSSDIVVQENRISNVIDFDSKVRILLQKTIEITEVFKMKYIQNIEKIHKIRNLLEVLCSDNVNINQKRDYLEGKFELNDNQIEELLKPAKIDKKDEKKEEKNEKFPITGLELMGKNINLYDNLNNKKNDNFKIDLVKDNHINNINKIIEPSVGIKDVIKTESTKKSNDNKLNNYEGELEDRLNEMNLGSVNELVDYNSELDEIDGMENGISSGKLMGNNKKEKRNKINLISPIPNINISNMVKNTTPNILGNNLQIKNDIGYSQNIINNNYTNNKSQLNKFGLANNIKSNDGLNTNGLNLPSKNLINNLQGTDLTSINNSLSDNNISLLNDFKNNIPSIKINNPNNSGNINIPNSISNKNIISTNNILSTAIDSFNKSDIDNILNSNVNSISNSNSKFPNTFSLNSNTNNLNLQVNSPYNNKSISSNINPNSIPTLNSLSNTNNQFSFPNKDIVKPFANNSYQNDISIDINKTNENLLTIKPIPINNSLNNSLSNYLPNINTPTNNIQMNNSVKMNISDQFLQNNINSLNNKTNTPDNNLFSLSNNKPENKLINNVLNTTKNNQLNEIQKNHSSGISSINDSNYFNKTNPQDLPIKQNNNKLDNNDKAKPKDEIFEELGEDEDISFLNKSKPKNIYQKYYNTTIDQSQANSIRKRSSIVEIKDKVKSFLDKLKLKLQTDIEDIKVRRNNLKQPQVINKFQKNLKRLDDQFFELKHNIITNLG